LIENILLANELQPFAALYAATEASGTYMGQLLVFWKALLPNVGGVVPSIITYSKLEQFEKAPALIFVTVLGITKYVNPLQLKKVYCEIDVKLDGTSNRVRFCLA
jgi:hypothetical protein